VQDAPASEGIDGGSDDNTFLEEDSFKGKRDAAGESTAVKGTRTLVAKCDPVPDFRASCSCMCVAVFAKSK
jgi:hypothetical protein